MEEITSIFQKKIKWLKFLNFNLLLLVLLFFLLDFLKITDIQEILGMKTFRLLFIVLLFSFLCLHYYSLPEKSRDKFSKFFELFTIFPITLLVLSMLGLSCYNPFIKQYLLEFCLLTSFSFYFTLKENTDYKKETRNNKKKTCLYIISFLVLLAFLIRYINLNSTNAHIDAYNHLTGAKSILSVGKTDYRRSYFLTYFISRLYSLTNPSSLQEYLYWARIPGIVIGSLSIIPLYLLVDKKYKTVGIISSILWLMSPWAIEMSRAVRGYIYYLFIIIISLLLLFYTLEKLLNFEKKHLFKIILSILFISFNTYYALFIDKYSTMKIIVPILCVGYFSFIIVNIKAIFKIFSKKKLLSILIFLLHIGAFYYILSLLQHNPDINFLPLEANMRWKTRFFGNNDLHWWSGFNFLYIEVFYIITGVVFAIKEKNKNYLLLFLTFILTLLGYIFFFKRYPNDRYIFYILPFFIILIAYGVYYLFKIRKHITNKLLCCLYVIFLVIFIFLSFSNFSMIKSLCRQSPDYLEDIFLSLENEIQKDDVVISYLNHAFWLEFELDPCNTYKYRSSDLEMPNKVQNIIESNNRGYLIITSHITNWRTLYPTDKHFYIGDTLIESFKTGDYYIIYRWNKE